MSGSGTPAVEPVKGPSVLFAPPAPRADGPQLHAKFWPFAAQTLCVRCHQPVETRYAVAVASTGVFEGMAHEECPE